MRIILTAALLCMQVYVALAQSGIKHLVFFKDKSNNPYSLTDPREFLTKKALDRRVKNNIPFDEKDLPVSPAYVHELASKGARIIYTLKWFNAAMITTEDPHVLEAISELPFIEHITKVGGRNREMSKAEKGIQQQYSIQPIKHASLPSRTNSTPSGILNYGNAWNQVSMIGLHHLHDLGFTGQGKEIVILDAGYWNVDQGAAFAYLWQHGLILGTRDFVDPGGNVFIQHTHGESVLSILGANLPGQIIGTAPDASYWLLRTEDAWGGEYIEEEYNWAAGAEFADSVGADIITSSLAYTTFDNPASNHTYSDLDGNTTPAAIAADLSASRGILVVNCAGNLGEETWHYISTPADGDSVFTVGAVDESGVYQQFSGKGPTSDGQIKPDVVAQGCNTAIIYGNGVLTVGTGTSFSTPVVSGALACLWQSVSNVTAIDVMTAVRNSASHANSPDNYTGWGIPDIMSARSNLISLSTTQFPNTELPVFWLSPNPFAVAPNLNASCLIDKPVKIEIFSISGQMISQTDFYMTSKVHQTLNGFSGLPAGMYIVRVSTQDHLEVLRAVKQ